ncbi:MAG: zinc-ribbon domain-containing protein [Lutisporaceae bacterium]
MYCSNCGSSLSEETKYCSVCGVHIAEKNNCINDEKGSCGNDSVNVIGFSSRIKDPAFENYIKNTNRWSWIFSLIIALAAVIGFYIYGETSSEMSNPEALYIGLGIGAMFIIIAMFQIIGRSRSKTWDGAVVDKKIEKKRRKRSSGENDYYWEEYTNFVVFIRADSGKKHEISTENDDTVYNYYQIGDRVRHHAGLNSYEKYDKSKDSIIFCNACASLNDIQDEYCIRCKCPLLK